MLILAMDTSLQKEKESFTGKPFFVTTIYGCKQK